MLLDFKIQNYKSFYNKTNISMIGDSAKKDHSDRLINVMENKKIRKYALPAMVIYGANASGKTSIISAANMMKQIVINGTIKKQIKNNDIRDLDICSYIHDIKKINEPIRFEITFKAKGNIYNYIISIVASYINPLRKIEKEELNIVEYNMIGTSCNEKLTNIYTRYEDKVEINKDKNVIRFLDKDESFVDDLSNLEKKFGENLDKEDLFLTTGFKSLISLKVSNDIISWFQEQLITIVDFNKKEPLISFDEIDGDKTSIFKNKQLDKLIKIADFGPQEIGYIKDNNTGKYELNSMYKTKGSKRGLILSSKLIESRGTVKLIDFWIEFMEYFRNGGTFILDEFDCSIHPELVGGIIDLFNNPDINKNHSQLIFNTHNPLYLQKRFFRRDQILFVEKDEDTYMSGVYKLSDIEIRNDANYMKNYFEGKFGALPFIDFESAMDDEEEGAD